ncbi:unnamed protein product, partial [Mesorhabditis belari]|uniref:Uncharacterized protein n=1 Tax=Mesorhabditis belari TaxID=2138241 RepID=A0AAF3J6G4_9BILA
MDGKSSPAPSFSPYVEASVSVPTERRKSSSKGPKSPMERPPIDFYVLSHGDLIEQAEEYRKKYKKLTVELNRIRDERNFLRDKYVTHKSERAQWDHEKTEWLERASEWDRVNKEKNGKQLEKISFLEERNKALIKKLQEKDETQKAADDRVRELEKDIEDILKCNKSTSEYKLPHVFRRRILEQAEKISYHELQNSLLLQQLEDNQFEIREMQRVQKRSLNVVNGVGKSEEVSSRSPAEKKTTKTATSVSKKSNRSVSQKQPKNEDNGEYSREMNDRSRYTPIGDDCKSGSPEAFQKVITSSKCSKRPAQEAMRKANSGKRHLPQFEQFPEGPLSWDSWDGNRGMIERGNSETRHGQRSAAGIRPSMNSVNETRFDRPPSNESYYFTSQPTSSRVQPPAVSEPPSYLPINPGSKQDLERGYFNPNRSSYSNESDVWLGQRDRHRSGVNDAYDWDVRRSGYNGPTFNPERSQFF